MLTNLKHRLSIEKYNAPYRGATSRYDFVNFYLGVTHDLKYIQNQLGFSSNFKGLKQKEKTNFEMLFIGEGSEPTATISSAGKYVHLLDDVEIDKDLSTWNTQNDAVVVKNEKSFNVKSAGLKDPVSISKTITVHPHDIIYIRFKIKKIKGRCDSIYIGTDNINGTGEDLKKINLINESTSIYVDKRLYCTQRETITFKIYLHKIPDTLESTEIKIEDISIRYMSEKDISIGSIEYELKSSLNNMEEKIKYLKNS